MEYIIRFCYFDPDYSCVARARSYEHSVSPLLDLSLNVEKFQVLCPAGLGFRFFLMERPLYYVAKAPLILLLLF